MDLGFLRTIPEHPDQIDTGSGRKTACSSRGNELLFTSARPLKGLRHVSDSSRLSFVPDFHVVSLHRIAGKHAGFSDSAGSRLGCLDPCVGP